MAKLLKLRRGTTTQHGSFTGAEGEVTVDTDKETLVVHDGSTAGGHPVAAEDMANVSSSDIAGRLSNDSLATSKLAAGALPTDVTIADANVSGNLTIESADIVDGTIVNADVNASAAIAGTKISPDFGSQNITTTGGLTVAGTTSLGESTTITGNDPNITFVDSNNNPDYKIFSNAGTFMLMDQTNSTEKFKVQADGHIDITPNTDFANGIDVTGNITTTSGNLTVDGIGSVEDTFKITDAAGTQYLLMGNQDSAGTNCPRVFSVGNAQLTIGIGDSWSSNTGGTVTSQFQIAKNGQITSIGNHDFNSGIDVTGNITCTGTVDGRDVATDGTKLDGIEASATADQTNAEIRAAVEAASDSNVFTDADHTKLNGIEASATADQTASEIASALNGQNVYTTGNIGRDATDYILFDDNDRMDIFVNGSNEFRFRNNGDFHADGDVYAFSTTISSDENLKKDIVTVADAVTKVEALKGVTFKWKKNDADSAGVIAQDVEKVLPQVVKTVNDMDGNEYKAVNYAGLTSILIEAVKDLSARIKVLEAK